MLEILNPHHVRKISEKIVISKGKTNSDMHELVTLGPQGVKWKKEKGKEKRLLIG